MQPNSHKLTESLIMCPSYSMCLVFLSRLSHCLAFSTFSSDTVEWQIGLLWGIVYVDYISRENNVSTLHFMEKLMTRVVLVLLIQKQMSCICHYSFVFHTVNWCWYYIQPTSYNQYKHNEKSAETKQTLSHRGLLDRRGNSASIHIQDSFMPAAPNDNTTDTQEAQIKSTHEQCK